MTGCGRAWNREALEAFHALRDEGDAMRAPLSSRALEMEQHVAACPRCTEELRSLRAERALFASRAASPAPVPPPFAAVLAAARRDRASRWHRLFSGGSALRRPPRAAWLGLAAAAAIAAYFTAGRAPDAPLIVAEPRSAFACYDDPSSLTAEAAAYATDRAVASAEDRYAACLVATPVGVCALPRDTDVTCGASWPLDDEVFEERARGGSLQ